MYVILNGKCNVESLNFAKHGKKDYSGYEPKVNRNKNAAECEEGAELKKSWTLDLNFTYEDDEDEDADANHKVLHAGEFFGEVSIIYNCKRTSSVLGNTYGTYGEIDEDSVLELFEEHPELETYLKERILRTYDDDLKVFLMEAFNHIDYLHDLPNEILLHIAFSMEARKMEKDEIVFLEEDNYENMLIILDGCLELYTHMDSGTEFPIEYLSSGSVINAHQFMIDRKALVSVRCAKATTFYTLNA